jgi:hypothetical protein
MQPEINERDAELLSAYTDDQLNAAEREQLEGRLQAEPQLRRELAELRQTVRLLQALPVLPAPRDFTLDAATAAQARVLQARQRRWWLAASSAAALLLVVVGLVVVLSQGNLDFGSGTTGPQVANAPTAVPTIPATDNTQPEIAQQEALETGADADLALPEADNTIAAFGDTVADEAAGARLAPPATAAQATQRLAPTPTIPQRAEAVPETAAEMAPPQTAEMAAARQATPNPAQALLALVGVYTRFDDAIVLYRTDAGNLTAGDITRLVLAAYAVITLQ